MIKNCTRNTFRFDTILLTDICIGRLSLYIYLFYWSIDATLSPPNLLLPSFSHHPPPRNLISIKMLSEITSLIFWLCTHWVSTCSKKCPNIQGECMSYLRCMPTYFVWQHFDWQSIDTSTLLSNAKAIWKINWSSSNLNGWNSDGNFQTMLGAIVTQKN